MCSWTSASSSSQPAASAISIPVPRISSASAIALVEPWACVEDSYANEERRTIKPGGRLLIVADGERPEVDALGLPFSPNGKPKEVLLKTSAVIPNLPNEAFDDIIYLGCDKGVIEQLNDKLAARAIMNIVLGTRPIGRPVSVGIGRVHYGMTRWVGTPGSSPADSYRHIPTNGELRAGDKVAVIGAGGPMGQMHVIRALCAGVPDVSVVGTDMDDARLEALRQKAEPLARANHLDLRLVNTQKTPLNETFTYFALMAPIGALVAHAVRDSSTDGALINIFAGIPAPTRQDLDLDTYIARRCYMFGTSGSVIRDMKIVLGKVENHQLDTNCSVDAIAGMAGAVAGIAAVENRTLAGKIIVYPMLHDIGLIPLSELHQHFPSVAAKLDKGGWCKAAEEELLKQV